MGHLLSPELQAECELHALSPGTAGRSRVSAGSLGTEPPEPCSLEQDQEDCSPP